MLCEHEFGVLSDEERNVFRFEPKDGTAFNLPQTLMGGQRIVVRLPEYERRDLVFRARIPGGAKHRAMRVLFNDKRIWQRLIEERGTLVSALIPAAWLEEYENTLVVANPGKKPLLYDAFWIEAASGLRQEVGFGVRPLGAFPEQQRRQLPVCGALKEAHSGRGRRAPLRYPVRRLQKEVASDKSLDSRLGLKWRFSVRHRAALRDQERVVNRLLSSVLGYYFNGGERLVLTGGTGTGKFFSPLTGRPYPSSAALEELALLFRGADSSRLHLNVVPAMDPEKVIPKLLWTGVQHSADSASFMVCRGWHGIPPKRVRLTASVPWQGETEVQVYRDVIPAFFGMVMPGYRPGSGAYDRTRTTSTRTIQVKANGEHRGLLRFDAGFAEAVLVRARRKGADWPPPPGRNRKKAAGAGSAVERVSAAVTDDPAGRFSRFFTGTPSAIVAGRLCSFYSTKCGKASKGAVDGASHVVPVHAESLYFTRGYGDSPARTAEGVAVATASMGGVEGDAFSFWVRPRIMETGDKEETPEQVRLLVRLGHRLYAASLKPGSWQRVKCRITGKQYLRGPPYAVFRIDRSWEEYGSGARIRFEINGMAFVSHPRQKLSGRVFSNGDGKHLNMVLLGPAGHKTDFRHRFSQQVKVNKVRRLNKDGSVTGCSYDYRPKAQLLTLEQIKFPVGDVDNLTSQLSHRAVKLCQQRNLKPILLRVILAR